MKIWLKSLPLINFYVKLPFTFLLNFVSEKRQVNFLYCIRIFYFFTIFYILMKGIE